MQVRITPRKWIAEDALVMAALRLAWRREPGVRTLLRQARGKKQYAIWSKTDPLPFIAYLARLIPSLIGMAVQGIRRLLAGRFAVRQKMATRGVQ
jgi:hypothetical protein